MAEETRAGWLRGLTQPPIQWVWELFLRCVEVHHSAPASAEVKKTVTNGLVEWLLIT
jgi:hypothetical protein